MKKLLSLALALALVFAAGCSANPAPGASGDPSPSTSDAPKPAEKQTFAAGCNASGGAFNVVGTGWCTLMNNVFDGKYSITAETTGGATSNMALLESGEIQFGMGGASSTYEAYNASADWTGGTKMLKSRLMWPMYPMGITAFALKSSGIENWDDMNGKTVGLGSKGSGVDSVLREILPALGINANIHNDTWANTVSAMKDGSVDVIITQTAGAWPSLTEIEATNEVNILELTDAQCETIMKVTPYYSKGEITAGTYKANADKAIQTCVMWAFAVCSEDLDADTVYEMVKATFEHYDDMITVYAGLAEGLKLDNIPNMPFLFHEGAIRYYTEQGITMAPIAEGFDVK